MGSSQVPSYRQSDIMPDRADLTNYRKIHIPKEKFKENWTTEQRRAWILQRIIEAGHPRFLEQEKIADMFDVSQPQISQDLDALSDSIKVHIGEDIDMLVESLYQSTIEELKEKEDYGELRKWIKDFTDYLMNRGKIKKAPDKQKVDVEYTPVEYDLVDVIDIEESEIEEETER